MIDKWDERFVRMAREVASWSKDPSTQVGSVAVLDKRILATGYNGFPKGVADHNHRLVDRPTKHKFVVHAEANTVYNAVHNGVSLAGATVYVWGLPVCSECAKALIQAGVARVVMATDKEIPDRWMESFELSAEMFEEVGVRHKILLYSSK